MAFEGQSNAIDAILVVDPLPAGRALVRRLEMQGQRVAHASSMDEALAVVRKQRPSLVVTELKVGAGSSLTWIESIRSISPHTRVVVVTAYGSIATAQAAIHAGACAYFTKPVDAGEVLAAYRDDAKSEPLKGMTLDTVRKAYIEEVLAQCGSVAKTARALHLDRRSLRRLMVRLNLKRPSETRELTT